jgi:bifunctional non-homologous end joining protein LigD
MLCTLVREIKDDPDFVYEVKWDGYRIISYADGDNVRLASRGGLDYSPKYPLVVEAIAALGHDVILDGEVVVFNDHGVPDFDTLQLYTGGRKPITYCVFDILWLDGHNLMELPLVQRKNLLKILISDNKVLRFSESFERGEDLYQSMLDKDWEGIVAKRKDSYYVQGERGSNWLKVPTVKRQEFVIGAWAESDKSRLFRSLLFGAYNEKGELEWIGRSGGGYKHKEMPEIMARLKTLEIPKSPFKNKILDTKGAVIHYIKPELVANFAFATWTKSGRIRKPATFLGFRVDKNPRDVVREVPKDIILDDEKLPLNSELETTALKGTKRDTPVYLNDDSHWKDLDKLPIDDERELAVDSENLKVNDLSKILWKNENITKADLMTYYASMSDFILPYLKQRPLSLYLKHISPTAPGLYIKDMEGRAPEFAETFKTARKHKKKGKRDIIEYLVCNNTATLLYVVNLGAIDLNPWTSTTSAPDNPGYIIIDLDPSDGDFEKAIETARAAKQLFDKLKLKAFPKTSGKTGIHLLIPCSGFKFEVARRLGSHICDMVHELVPSITTREVTVNKRGSKLFVDDSQNDYADTIAAAYSVRPFHIPSVSTPLDWKEIKTGLDSTEFTIKTIQKRIDKKGDLLKDVFNEAIRTDNYKSLKKM